MLRSNIWLFPYTKLMFWGWLGCGRVWTPPLIRCYPQIFRRVPAQIIIWTGHLVEVLLRSHPSRLNNNGQEHDHYWGGNLCSDNAWQLPGMISLIITSNIVPDTFADWPSTSHQICGHQLRPTHQRQVFGFALAPVWARLNVARLASQRAPNTRSVVLLNQVINCYIF